MRGDNPVRRNQRWMATVILAGLAMVVVGVFLPWVKGHLFFPPTSINGLGIGYVIGSSFRHGHDGLLVLLLALAAGIAAAQYFFRSNLLVGTVVWVLSGAVAGIACYDYARIFWDIHNIYILADPGGRRTLNPLDYIGVGLYGTIAGSLISTVGAVVAVERAAKQKELAEFQEWDARFKSMPDWGAPPIRSRKGRP